MTTESFESRLVRVEERMDKQREDINAVVRRQDQQHIDMKAVVDKLNALNLTINRVLWVLSGGVGFWILQQMGLVEFLKKALL